VVPGISESVREDVVLVRSVEVTVRCHDGMPGAAGVEPTMGEGNCFLDKTQTYEKVKKAVTSMLYFT